MKKPKFVPARLRNYITQTLGNFVYRYVESGPSGPLQVHEQENLLFVGENLETSMKEALKCDNPSTRQELMNFISSLKKGEKFGVRLRLSCQVLALDADEDGPGKLLVTAGLHWEGGPRPPLTKSVPVAYESFVLLRKLLPMALEEACEIF